MSADPKTLWRCPAPEADEANPFFVLDLPTSASALEIERQKNKLLGMLELDLRQAARFETPLGGRARSHELVRRAAEELQDPSRRLIWEVWAAVETDEDEPLRVAVVALGELRTRLERKQPIAAEDVELVGAAWDDALAADETWCQISSRAEALSAGDPDQFLESLEEDAERQLATLIERAPAFDLDEIDSEIGTRAVQRFLDREVEGIELACQRLIQTRSGDKEVWQRWRAFTAHYRKVVNRRGVYALRCAFDAIYDDLGDFGVARFDEQDYELSTAIFTWLRDRAVHLEDEDAVALQSRNAAAGADAAAEKEFELAEPAQDRQSRFSAWGFLIAVLIVISSARFCLRSNSPSFDSSDLHLYEYEPSRLNITEETGKRLQESIHRTLEETPYEPRLESTPGFEERPLQAAPDGTITSP